ncbi:polysaccharide deacetylase family sporulation protein PdaB [Haloimpatiens sp. FM7330]|uniref:polysaccharide deacetylase family sporulation protein PdaB n=1 Tax=Haloimpatiens sp. FM7330 TaxID=3298610 RepID=UPI00363F544E
MKKIQKRTTVISIIAAVILILVFCYTTKDRAVFFMQKRKLPIYCVNTNDKKIAISFDASWGADKTDKILEVLDKYDIKATFFLVGGWVDEHPDKVKEMHKRGHEIGNHSNRHPNMTKISREKIIKEIEITDSKIMKLTDEMPKLFRCPEGAYNDLVIKTVEDTNHYCIQWDVDSIDWKGQGADLEYNRVIKKTKPGSIILFHNDAKYTPENLPRVIENLKSKGYEFVKISELIYKDNYRIDNAGKQILN